MCHVGGGAKQAGLILKKIRQAVLFVVLQFVMQTFILNYLRNVSNSPL